jgi:hypothetical protein
MKSVCKMVILVSIFSLFSLSMPAQAEPGGTIPGTPQIAPPLIREGAFAVKLCAALSLGTTENEVEAENRLSEVGILPKNGWMADYPVTPDIFGELHAAVSGAAEAKRLSMSKDEALKGLNDVNFEVNLSLAPASLGKTVDMIPPDYGNVPDPSAVENYYSSAGPPVFSYYAPPPAYMSLYDWVPYPFWWTSVWFPGYFILRDFHRPFYVNRNAFFVSNHYYNTRLNRFSRVDPVARFRGWTSTSVGVPRTHGFGPSGAHGSGGTIHNWPRSTVIHRGVTSNPPRRGIAAPVIPALHGAGMVAQLPRGAASFAPMYRGGGTVGSSSRGGVVLTSSHMRSGGGFSGHSGGFSSRGGGSSGHNGGFSGYRGGSSGRGHR